MTEIVQCNSNGFEGTINFRFVGWAEYREWHGYVKKGHKRTIHETKKRGIEIDNEDVELLNTFWSSALLLENWDICSESGAPIPMPNIGMHPSEWVYTEEVEGEEIKKRVPMRLFQWFRIVASEYISQEITPNVNTPPKK